MEISKSNVVKPDVNSICLQDEIPKISEEHILVSKGALFSVANSIACVTSVKIVNGVPEVTTVRVS